MGQLRSIQVFVVGQARRPGTYTLSSLSTLVTALFATGGPSVQGSLRDIQLRRNGQTISHFDLYDLLIFGDMSKDAQLLPGDVIYIPPVGAQIAISGDVHNPAIYELKGDTTVEEALRFAGGLSATASLLRASLERLDAQKNRTVLDISLQGPAWRRQCNKPTSCACFPSLRSFKTPLPCVAMLQKQGGFPGIRA